MDAHSINTTVCYIRSNGQTLMLQRAKNDGLQGKWIVPGGKFEPGETPEECALREVEEETGLKLTEINFRGIITFVQSKPDIYIKTCTCFVFESFAFQGNICTSPEGELRWIADKEIARMDIPSSDRIFLPWIYEKTGLFSAKFCGGLKSVTFYGLTQE